MEGRSTATIEVVEEDLTDPFFSEDLEVAAAARGTSSPCTGCVGSCGASCTRAVPMPPPPVDS